GHVLARLRVRERSHTQLGGSVDLGIPGHWNGIARAVRVLDGARCEPAAAAANRAQPQPSGCLRRDVLCLLLPLRHLLLGDLLPAGHAWLLAARVGLGVLADVRRPSARLQSLDDRSAAEGRTTTSCARWFGGRGGRDGVACAARTPHRLRRRRARPARASGPRSRFGHRAVAQRRDLRRAATGRRGGLSDRHSRPAAWSLHQHLAAELGLRDRGRVLPHDARVCGARYERTRARKWVRHRVVVDRRYRRRWSYHRRLALPAGASIPAGEPCEEMSTKKQPGGSAMLAGRPVARIGYGAMQLPGPGVLGPPRDRAVALALLRRAVELGVNHIDTAEYYGPDVANELIHAALHPYPEDLVLVTKVGAERDGRGNWISAQRPNQLRA